jgi:hypothetical protein
MNDPAAAGCSEGKIVPMSDLELLSGPEIVTILWEILAASIPSLVSTTDCVQIVSIN